MKRALTIILYGLPVAIVAYSSKTLVPAVDTKNLLIRALVMIAAFVIAILYATDSGFRGEAAARLRSLWKNPLGKAFVASYVILIISTIFAYVPFAAFFGSATRGEGFIGLSFYYFLTLLCFIAFDKKEWLMFWKITVIAGYLVVLKELIQFAGGAYRPGSLMDNPIFLAGYLLGIIYASLLLWSRGMSTKSASLKWLGGAGVISAIVGIFITQSRGVMLGMVVGAFVALMYMVLKGSALGPRGTTVRKVSAGILIALVLVGGTFAVTRHATFWTHIPGFSRLAQFSSSDSTTQSRLENARLTLRAVRPTGANIKNTLVGWGWDNYIFAWQANYDPKLYQYDRAIFDRAHNKLLDVLVMNGVLGLLAYLAIWLYLVRSALYLGKSSALECAAALFFLTAFFVQNLFVFDTIITFFFFFTVIGYMLFESSKKYDTEK